MDKRKPDFRGAGLFKDSPPKPSPQRRLGAPMSMAARAAIPALLPMEW